MTIEQRRSGLCHGPDCPHHITPATFSADFCSQACQAKWQAALVGVKADSSLTAPPGDSFATYRRRWLPLRPAVPPNLAEHAEQVARRRARARAGRGIEGSAPVFDESVDALTECVCHLMLNPPCTWCETGGEAATSQVLAGGAVAEAALELGLGREVQSLRFEPVAEDRWEITLRTPVPIEPGQSLLLAGFDGSSDGTYTVVEAMPSGTYKIVADEDHPEVSEAYLVGCSREEFARLQAGYAPEVGEAATPVAQKALHASSHDSGHDRWFRRLWRWVWFRG